MAEGERGEDEVPVLPYRVPRPWRRGPRLGLGARLWIVAVTSGVVLLYITYVNRDYGRKPDPAIEWVSPGAIGVLAGLAVAACARWRHEVD